MTNEKPIGGEGREGCAGGGGGGRLYNLSPVSDKISSTQRPNCKTDADDVRAFFGIQTKAEETNMRPSHYTDAPFDVTQVQEYVFINAIEALPDDRKAAAGWVLMAMKHLLRAGKKDDIFLELQKAENYLHRARTKQWLKEEDK